MEAKEFLMKAEPGVYYINFIEWYWDDVENEPTKEHTKAAYYQRNLKGLDEHIELLDQLRAKFGVDVLIRRHLSVFEQTASAVQLEPRKWVLSNGIGGLLSVDGKITLAEHTPLSTWGSQKKAMEFYNDWRAKQAGGPLALLFRASRDVTDKHNGEEFDRLREATDAIACLV